MNDNQQDKPKVVIPRPSFPIHIRIFEFIWIGIIGAIIGGIIGGITWIFVREVECIYHGLWIGSLAFIAFYKIALLWAGRHYHFEHGNYDDAIADYTDAIRRDPKWADNYFWRGMCYLDTGENDKAIADFTEAIRLDRKVAHFYGDRGNCYGMTGELDKAIADFTKAIRLDPNDADNYSSRGWCYVQTGELDKAHADFSKARGLDYSDEPKTWPTPVAAGTLDRVIADCTEAIRLDPTDAVAYYNRSWRYAQKGEYEKAVDDVTEALRLDPKLPDVQEKYSIMCTVVSMLLNRFQKATHNSMESPLKRILQCAWKLGMTGGTIVGAGDGLSDDEGDGAD